MALGWATLNIILEIISPTQATGTTKETDVPLELFTGAHLQRRINAIPYHSSIPLLYTIRFNASIELPPTNNQINFCRTNYIRDPSRDCQIQNNLWTLSVKIHEQLEIERTLLFPQNTSTRNKRGLNFLSQMFNWCCDLVNEDELHNVITNEQELFTHTNDLTDFVATDHKDLVLVTENLNNFSKNVENLAQNVHSSLKLMQEEINDLSNASSSIVMAHLYSFTQQTWSYLYYKMYFDNLREILATCTNKNLPTTLVNHTVLLSDLQKLNDLASNKSLTLAIDPINKLHLYYNLKLTSCKISKEKILIKIQIPFKKAHLNYVVYENTPVPLVWRDKICYLTTTKAIIIKTENFTQAIHSDDKNCNLNNSPLCLIPRETITTDHTHTCLIHIIEGSSLSFLKEICHTTCYPMTPHPIITPILPNKFLITNIQKNLKIKCNDPKHSKSITNNQQAGTLELILPCDCHIRDDTTVLINSIEPCDSRDFNNPKLTHLLPLTWTKFNSITIFPFETNLRHKFEHISEVLNENWTFNTPTYFIHNLVKQQTLQHIQPKAIGPNLLQDTNFILYIFLGWTTTLTVLLLLTLYYIHILQIKIRFLMPPATKTRDYPNQN